MKANETRANSFLARHARGIPLHPTSLPAAPILTAENDIPRAEGELSANRLRAAGVPQISRMVAGCGRGFTHIEPQEAADDAWRLIYLRLREAFR